MHRSSTFLQIKTLVCLITAISLIVPPAAISQGVNFDSESRDHLRSVQVSNDPDPRTNPTFAGLEEALRRAGQEARPSVETPGPVTPARIAPPAPTAPRTLWQSRGQEAISNRPIAPASPRLAAAAASGLEETIPAVSKRLQELGGDAGQRFPPLREAVRKLIQITPESESVARGWAGPATDWLAYHLLRDGVPAQALTPEIGVSLRVHQGTEEAQLTDEVTGGRDNLSAGMVRTASKRYEIRLDYLSEPAPERLDHALWEETLHVVEAFEREILGLPVSPLVSSLEDIASAMVKPDHYIQTSRNEATPYLMALADGFDNDLPLGKIDGLTAAYEQHSEVHDMLAPTVRLDTMPDYHVSARLISEPAARKVQEWIQGRPSLAPWRGRLLFRMRQLSTLTNLLDPLYQRKYSDDPGSFEKDKEAVQLRHERLIKDLKPRHPHAALLAFGAEITTFLVEPDDLYRELSDRLHDRLAQTAEGSAGDPIRHWLHQWMEELQQEEDQIRATPETAGLEGANSTPWTMQEALHLVAEQMGRALRIQSDSNPSGDQELHTQLREGINRAIESSPEGHPAVVWGAGMLQNIPDGLFLSGKFPWIVLVDLYPEATKQALMERGLDPLVQNGKIRIVEADLSMISQEFLQEVDRTIEASTSVEDARARLIRLYHSYSERGIQIVTSQPPSTLLESVGSQGAGLVISSMLLNNLLAYFQKAAEQKIARKFRFSLDVGRKLFEGDWEYMAAHTYLNDQLLLSGHPNLLRSLLRPGGIAYLATSLAFMEPNLLQKVRVMDPNTGNIRGLTFQEAASALQTISETFRDPTFEAPSGAFILQLWKIFQTHTPENIPIVWSGPMVLNFPEGPWYRNHFEPLNTKVWIWDRLPQGNPELVQSLTLRLPAQKIPSGSTAGLKSESMPLNQPIDAALIPDLYERYQALRAIAQIQAQAGQFEEALATLEKIHDNYEKAKMFAAIGLAQARAGQNPAATLQPALAILEKIPNTRREINDRDRVAVLAVVAQAQAQMGQFEAAKATARKARFLYQGAVEILFDETPILAAIAKIQAQAGKFDEAFATLTPIPIDATHDGMDKVEGLIAIAQAQAQAGQDPTSTFQEALATARRIRSSPGGSSLFTGLGALITIAQAQATAGQDPVPTFQEALAMVEEIGEASVMSSQLAEIALAQAQVGQDSMPAFQRALAEARNIRRHPDGDNRSERLTKIAAAQAQAGQVEAALSTIQEIRTDSDKASALTTVIAQIQAVGQLETVLAAIQKLPDGSYRNSPFAAIATALARAGQFGVAHTTTQEILYASKRAPVLAAIAEAQARAGQFQQALATSREVESVNEQVDALTAIAQAQARAGQDPAPTFRETLDIARALSPRDGKFEQLAKVSTAQAQAGYIEAALATAGEIPEKQIELKSKTLASIVLAQARFSVEAKSTMTAQTKPVVIDAPTHTLSQPNTEWVRLEVETAKLRFPGVEFPGGISGVYLVPADARSTIRFYSHDTLLPMLERVVEQEFKNLPEGLTVQPVPLPPTPDDLKAPGLVAKDRWLSLPESYKQILLPIVEMALGDQAPSLLSLVLYALEGKQGEIKAVIGAMTLRDAQGNIWLAFFV